MDSTGYDQSHEKIEYRVPIVRIFLSILIFLMAVFVHIALIMSAFMMPLPIYFTGVFLVRILLFSGIIFLFFLFFASWMNLFIYPILKWIGGNIVCPGCGGRVVACEYHHPAFYFAPLSFAVLCEKCKNDSLFEAGIFSRVIRHMPLHGPLDAESTGGNVDGGAEPVLRKRVHFGFRVPLSVLASNALIVMPLHLCIFAVGELVFLPLYTILILFYPTIPEVFRVDAISLFGLILVLILMPIVALIRRSKAGLLENHSLRKWTAENIRCPSCNGRLSEFKSVEKRSNVYTVQCDKCKKIMALEGGYTADPYLRFA